MKKIFLLSLVFSLLSLQSAKADPTYAVLDENNNVTNIIVCGAACDGGTFAGQKVVLQVAANPVTNENRGGYWNGPGTAKYESDQSFVVHRPIPIIKSETECDEEMLNCITTSAVVNGSAYTFKYEDTLGTDLSEVEKQIPPKDETGATISVTTDYTDESIFFQNRKSSEEVRAEAAIRNLSLITFKINKLISMLGLWLK
jgi:hypothetical protein